MKRLPFAHENLAPPGDPNRGPEFVRRELEAIGNNVVRLPTARVERRPDGRRKRPKVIGLTEAGGRRLPSVEHYGDPVRSTKTEGRANVALYLRNGLEGPPPEWFAHKATWPKVNDPSKRHAARVTLIKELDGLAVVVGHGPQAPNPRLPKDTNAALVAAREEWVDDTAAILGRYERVIWLGDPNELMADVLHALGDPTAARGGDGTDAVLVRGYVLESASTPASVNGVPMLTDHKKCLLGRAVVR